MLTERSTDCGRYTEPYHGPNNRLDPRLMDVQAEESSEMNTLPVVGESNSEVSETVAFLDNNGGVKVDAPAHNDVVADIDGTEDIGLGTFLARPTLIATHVWSTADATGVLATYNPWTLFFQDTAIRKKIDNFAFFRGNLHVKLIINGTPFQYGALRFCYSPLEGPVKNKIRTNPTSALPLLVPYSQQPGYFVYPQANAGGEMTLPFVYHKNWLDITSATDVANMGTARLVNYAPLKVAVAGGTTSVTVNLYAWLTDVKLMASTSKLALQGDEYVEGPVSGPATAVARIAATLTQIPVIGKFARATQLGAGALASVARLFGYTNVPVIAPVMGFMPMNGPMLASAHIGTAVQKLTLDPKQELSIDPSLHGVDGVDELSINYLKQKESYFGVTSWATGDTKGTVLFNMRVNPALCAQVDLVNGAAVAVAKRVYHTPLSYIGGMFRNWRGSLILHLKIVTTKFHKGRLKISYDPRADISVTDASTNTVYTHILDIGEVDDIEIEIPYHQATAWLKYDPTITDNWTPGNANAPRAGIDNGGLTITVLNNLSAPSSGSVNILAFIRGGDDFEFANPADHIGCDSTNPIPSMWDVQAEDHVELIADRVTLGSKASVAAERYDMNFGECICSLRNVLHRSTVVDTVPIPTTLAGFVAGYQKVYRIMPASGGYYPNLAWPVTANKTLAAGTYQYSYNTMHPMTYVAGMFLGYRGGANITVTPAVETINSVQDFRVFRRISQPDFISQFINTFFGYTAADSASKKSAFLSTFTYTQDGLSGMAIDSTLTNGSLVFNLPDYKEFNFSLVDPDANTAFSQTADGTSTQAAEVRFLVKTSGAASTIGGTIQTEQCAGADFTCLFFVCCPTLDYVNAVPSTV